MGFKNLFGRRSIQGVQKSSKNQLPQSRPSVFESLEERRLYAATPIKVASVVADNRGWVEIRLSKSIGVGVSLKKVFREFQAGGDGILNTLDDVQIPATVGWNAATKTMTLKANTAADSSYRIKLYSSGLFDTDGLHLDGEFNGSFPSGNGVAGGDFQFRSKRDSGSLPTARMTTSAGLITVRLDKTNAPITVNNFIAYINAGLYDGTVIHRNGRTDFQNGPINIIQGGGYTAANLAAGVHITTFAPIALESNLPNNRGTIAMARTNVANSATSEFFFNTQANSFLNPTIPGSDGYAVFGTVTSGQTAIDNIFAANSIAVGPFNSVPQINAQDVVFTHVAMQMKIATV